MMTNTNNTNTSSATINPCIDRHFDEALTGNMFRKHCRCMFKMHHNLDAIVIDFENNIGYITNGHLKINSNTFNLKKFGNDFSRLNRFIALTVRDGRSTDQISTILYRDGHMETFHMYNFEGLVEEVIRRAKELHFAYIGEFRKLNIHEIVIIEDTDHHTYYPATIIRHRDGSKSIYLLDVNPFTANVVVKRELSRSFWSTKRDFNSKATHTDIWDDTTYNIHNFVIDRIINI